MLAMLVFLAGSAGLRAYISFILDHNHAYGTLAAPIAALLFFFVLALGVLLGAEFNAAIEQRKPAQIRPAAGARPAQLAGVPRRRARRHRGAPSRRATRVGAPDEARDADRRPQPRQSRTLS